MRTLLLAAVVLSFTASLAGGCMMPGGGPSVGTSPPAPLEVKADANPSTIWVVKAVQVDDHLFYGLFACYRAEQPAAPKCYLAEIQGNVGKDGLSWPGEVEVEDGVVIPVRGDRRPSGELD